MVIRLQMMCGVEERRKTIGGEQSKYERGRQKVPLATMYLGEGAGGGGNK